MPDYYLFYQNMSSFNGDNAERNLKFSNAMQIISGKLNKGQVVAAAFTDIQRLDWLALDKSLSGIASHLDGGLGASALFATDLYGTVEYTAVCVNKKFVVEQSGRVMRVKQEKGDPVWKCVSDWEVPLDNSQRSVTGDSVSKLPAKLVNDYFDNRARGLAYMCGKFGGQKMIIGFTDRISAEGRDNTYQLLTSIMRLIWDKYPDYNGCPTIFGGSFTFTPAPLDRPYYAVYACTPSGVSTAAPSKDDKHKDDKAAPGGCVPLATSWQNKEGFDFWVANKEITNDNASVHKETMEVSHHCGISLRLPLEVLSEGVKK